MTLKEAFLSILQIGTVDDNTLEFGLIAAGLTSADNFTRDKVEDLERAAIPVLQSLMSVSGQSEGGYSISVSKDGIKERLLFLANKYGITDIVSQVNSVPQITSRKLW